MPTDDGKEEREEGESFTIDYVENTLHLINAAGEAVQPFLPLITCVTGIINEIVYVYDNAKYNLKICNSLMDRVNAAEAAIKTLKRRKTENEKNFQNEGYYKTFLRFIDILKRIRNFIKDVSTLQSYKRVFNANTIRKKFEELINEFEVTMRDLHFAMAVTNEDQRKLDQQGLESDIAEMMNFLEKIEGNIIDQNKAINTVIQEVKIIKNQLDTSTIPDNIKKMKSHEIKPSELQDPPHGKSDDARGRVTKKIYKVHDVACKIVAISDDDNRSQAELARYQAQLAILRKLRDSPNILKFYGISKISRSQVIVLEWAELGSLREL
ncbi:11344_t:CDS:2, partial [Acaulospora morrowiae]